MTDDDVVRDDEKDPLVELLAEDDSAVESLDALIDAELDENDEDEEKDPFTAYNGDEDEDQLYSY